DTVGRNSAENAVPARLLVGNLLGGRHLPEVGLRAVGSWQPVRLEGRWPGPSLTSASTSRMLGSGFCWGRPVVDGRRRAHQHPVAAIMHHVRLKLHVFCQRPVRSHAQVLEHTVIGPYRLLCGKVAIGNEA